MRCRASRPAGNAKRCDAMPHTTHEAHATASAGPLARQQVLLQARQPRACARYMVLEFCDGGTFEDYDVGGAAGFAEACILFRGVILALEYLHSWGIAHRDIKVRKGALSHHSLDSYLAPPSARAA